MKLWVKLWREEWVKLLAFTVLMSVISVLQTVFWPTLQQMLPSMQKAVPEMFQGFIGSFVEEGYAYFIITQQFLKNVGMFGGFLAVLLAGAALSRETEAGTFEFLLAHPISRSRVLLEKYLFGMGVLFVPIVLSTVLVAPASGLIDKQIDLLNLFIAGVYGFLALAVLYSAVFAISAYMDNQMHTISIGIGLVLVMGILGIFEETKMFSVFGWFDGPTMLPIINEGKLPLLVTGGFLAACAIGYGIAWRRFINADI